ncbi:MAG: cytochrome c oxidase subunit 3 [Myxococcota bacterium]
MRATGSDRLRLASERQQIIPDAVLGMLVFILTEVMFFAGMISAFAIIKASAPLWPPLGQPRLPAGATAFNTAVLLASGVFLYRGRVTFGRDRRAALRPLGIALALGAFFVVFQGAEWVALVREGLTLTSSSLGSFFYLIVGMHALHAVAAIGILGRMWLRLRRGWLTRAQLATAEVFWYFVVGVWPILYLVVYL